MDERWLCEDPLQHTAAGTPDPLPQIQTGDEEDAAMTVAAEGPLLADLVESPTQEILSYQRISNPTLKCLLIVSGHFTSACNALNHYNDIQ